MRSHANTPESRIKKLGTASLNRLQGIFMGWNFFSSGFLSSAFLLKYSFLCLLNKFRAKFSKFYDDWSGLQISLKFWEPYQITKPYHIYLFHFQVTLDGKTFQCLSLSWKCWWLSKYINYHSSMKLCLR